MSATNDAVFHRRNKQIQDAIDGQNLKQALQLIEKRMKKGEDSRFLKAWKAEILYRHADDAHRQRGLAETLELCKLEPPTTDLDTLEILQETLQKIGGQEDTMRSLWEKAAKAKPQDLEVQLRWFSYAFEGDDWKSAQKAAMSLQSNFPKTRKYYFWAIFLSYLVAVDKNSSEAERKLFGTLAYRMASKAADSVPADPKELLSTPRAIQNAEELLLLIKICESQGRHSEVVKLLASHNVGLSSRIVQNDWPFVGEKLSGLEKAEMWAEGLSYARDLLAIPTNESEEKTLQERDDWAVWSLLVHSVQNIKNTETTAEIRKFIDEFIKAVPRSRNAQLARLDLIHWSFKSGSLKSDELITACQEYFDRNKTKLYCFVDLRKYLSDLDKGSLTEFIQYASRTNGIQGDMKENDPFKDVPAINALKLEYCFLLSADEANATQPKVEDFVSRCLQIFRGAKRPERTAAGSTIESQPSDDLCLLAAMSLIRFSGGWINGKPDQIPDTSLIRAAGILERLLLDSPHNYNALLLLVRIYLRLGAGSLALRTFSKLSVKQLQYETVAHNLFTRLATIHPHSAPPVEGAEYKDFHPQSAFVQALNFYRTADVTTVRNRTNGLEYGSYVNVEGTIDLQRRLKHSICRKMWALDVKRIQRLAGGDNMGRYSDLARETSPTVDQRVFDAFMNCEAPGQATFEERVRLGPLPKERWVKSAQLTDQLFDLLKNLAAQKPVSSDFDVPSLDDLLGSDAESEMTASEIESVKLHLNLLKVAKLLSGSKSVSSEEVDACLSQVEQWLELTSKDFALDGAKLSPVVSRTAVFLKPETPSAPSWKYLHDAFLVLECLKALSFIYTIASKKGSKTAKLPKDRVEKLAGLIGEAYESARANIRALKSRISEPGMLGSLVDLVLAGGQQLRTELEKTLDMPALELVCGELMESWEGSLDGALSVKL
ncbi:MDM20/NAA25 family protein [Aspergillus novofumigatus IBT 16806]|uniref:Putative cytoskeleton organization protein n=1 Tax=Aspergillus novofumigatus (strain IBT 16806) TaxID=1392255 RepID=A0A2I1C5X7_ASPN1|nr:putative cytoskeleton organization protein [Aspergillus novofumigatus IBT 16806]PKX93059.1 putative cytoskeleton organization protein [Aspergillus novofumigatus IBT 16806]